MVKKRKHFTALQLEQALIEEMKMAESLHVPANMLSFSITFALKAEVRLFGDRQPSDRAPEFNNYLAEVLRKARLEREDVARQMQQRIVDPAKQIIIPKN